MASTEMPRRVGPYEIVSRLGEGGMAETYVGLRRGPGGFAQRVCVKRLRPELERDPEFVRQFMAEAAIAARLRHAAIAQVLDFGCDEGDYYLALELIDGCDLHELLAASGGLLPHGLVLHVAIELATALDFAHRAGGETDGTAAAVVHRDVSPSNTLVSREGEVKLTDFGIARSLGAAQHTRTGIVKGKVPYMAPEYARSGQLDPRSDLFSLGVLLYESLCGTRPHDGATDLETLERASRGQRVPLANRAPDAPVGLIEIVECLLEPNPELRHQSAAVLLEALLELAPSTRVRLDLGARVSRIVRARGAARGRSAAAEPHVPTEVMVDSGASTAAPAPSDPHRLEIGAATPTAAPPAEPAMDSASRAVRGLRVRRGPWIALGIALLFAASVLALALLRAQGKRATDAPKAATATRAPAKDPRARPATSQPIVQRPEPAGDLPAAPAGTAIAEMQAPVDLLGADTGRSQRAWIEVIVVPYGEVTIDGKYVGKSPVTIAVQPGEHAIEARGKGATINRRVSLGPKERKRIVLR